MLSHLLHGDFGVDQSAVRWEAFVKDGKTYSYFGIGPALLRLPLLLTGTLSTTDITALSIVIATCIAAYCKCASALVIKQRSHESAFTTSIYLMLVLSILIAGPQIQFLKASIYQEAICWAMALNAAFIYCAIRGLFLKPGFSQSLLVTMACLAGLSLLTRVTSGIGLYVALTLLILSIAGRETRGMGITSKAFVQWILSPRALLPFLALAGFVVLCGAVNYGRWGNPLSFMDVHLNVLMVPDRIAVVDNYGEFNLNRLWFSAAYYFFPINFISGPDGRFLFADFRQRYYDGVELPPASILVSDPLLVLLAGVLIWNAIRGGLKSAFDLRHITTLMIGFAIPVFFILTYYFLAFRFRGEFYAILEFAALLGFYTIVRSGHALSSNVKQRLETLIACIVIFSVISSHFFLAAYKVSPFARPESYLQPGWIASYSRAISVWAGTATDIW